MDRFECKHGVNLKYICDCQQKEQEKVLQETLTGGRSGLTSGSVACCGFGDYSCQIPMPIGGRMQGIDFCIADIVAALNAANMPTVASCCGHGQIDAIITLQDGRDLKVERTQVKKQ